MRAEAEAKQAALDLAEEQRQQAALAAEKEHARQLEVCFKNIFLFYGVLFKIMLQLSLNYFKLKFKF